MSSTNKFFRFFLFQRTPEPGLSAGRHRAFWLWNSLMLLFAAAGVTAVMLLLAPGDYRLAVFLGYFRHPLIFLANFLPIALLMLLGLAVTARPWAAYLFGAVPAMALAFGNYYKLAFRDDPVLFADLLILGEAGEMAGQYQLFLDWKLILALACILAGFLILFFLVRGRPNGRARIISAVAVLAAVLLGGRAYIGDGLYEATGTNLEYLNQWSSTHQHISRGSLYPFLYSINEAFPSPAEGYDEDEVADLLSQYQSAGIPEDEKVNIVGIMLEAFSDFSSFDGIEFAQDAYAVYHALEAESYTGNLVTNIFAGNTVNSERAFLTGMSTQYNWRGSTNSYVWYFKDQGYETWGDHPCYQWFYNRQNVNTYLGFDSYRFVENYYVQFNDGVSMDDVFFPELTAELLERMESDAPQFSFSVSYQGHGPYDDSVCEWGDVDDYMPTTTWTRPPATSWPTTSAPSWTPRSTSASWSIPCGRATSPWCSSSSATTSPGSATATQSTRRWASTWTRAPRRASTTTGQPATSSGPTTRPKRRWALTSPARAPTSPPAS